MHNGNFRANLFPVIKRPINKKSPYVKYNYEIIANNIEVLKKHHLFAGKYRCDEDQLEGLSVLLSEHIKKPLSFANRIMIVFIQFLSDDIP